MTSQKEERRDYPELIETFTQGEKTDENDIQMKYRLFLPEIQPEQNAPLVLFLHGAGERGDDNVSQLKMTSGVVFADPKFQKKHPCFVLAPQTPQGYATSQPEIEALVLEILWEVIRTNPVDRDRIYITGLSMGAIATWRYIVKYHDLFAAAMPVCGSGDPYDVRSAIRIPIRTYHAADDPVLPVSGENLALKKERRYASVYGTRDLVLSLRAAGKTNLTYIEYPAGFIAETFQVDDPGIAHAAWELAYRDAEGLEWLFAQTKKNQYEVNYIRPGLWNINDAMGSSCYLVEGAERALLIDTAMSESDIMPVAEKLTKLPVSLAVTHVHGDHCFHMDEFEEVYLAEKELEILPVMQAMMMPKKDFSKKRYTFVEDGGQINLGATLIEAFLFPGHTPASVVFVDHRHQCIFTGDAVGSGFGVLMAIPGASGLSLYLEHLVRFEKLLEQYPDYTLYGGHRWQEEGFLGAQETYNPLCLQQVQDLAILCKKLLDGEEVECEIQNNNWTEEDVIYAKWGKAGIWVCRNQIQ